MADLNEQYAEITEQIKTLEIDIQMCNKNSKKQQLELQRKKKQIDQAINSYDFDINNLEDDYQAEHHSQQLESIQQIMKSINIRMEEIFESQKNLVSNQPAGDFNTYYNTSQGPVYTNSVIRNNNTQSQIRPTQIESEIINLEDIQPQKFQLKKQQQSQPQKAQNGRFYFDENNTSQNQQTNNTSNILQKSVSQGNNMSIIQQQQQFSQQLKSSQMQPQFQRQTSQFGNPYLAQQQNQFQKSLINNPQQLQQQYNANIPNNMQTMNTQFFTEENLNPADLSQSFIIVNEQLRTGNFFQGRKCAAMHCKNVCVVCCSKCGIWVCEKHKYKRRKDKKQQSYLQQQNIDINAIKRQYCKNCGKKKKEVANCWRYSLYCCLFGSLAISLLAVILVLAA